MLLLTGIEPDVKLMRCVPASWTCKSKIVPKKIWDDSGSGGGKPGSMWIVNSLEMIAIVSGHESPKDDYYDFNSSKFFMDGLQSAKK